MVVTRSSTKVEVSGVIRRSNRKEGTVLPLHCSAEEVLLKVKYKRILEYIRREFSKGHAHLCHTLLNLWGYISLFWSFPQDNWWKQTSVPQIDLLNIFTSRAVAVSIVERLANSYQMTPCGTEYQDVEDLVRSSPDVKTARAKTFRYSRLKQHMNVVSIVLSSAAK